MAYKIVRKYFDENHPDHNKRIDSGLTLEEAQKHCSDESTHEKGVWMDVYYEDISEVIYWGGEELIPPRRHSFLDKVCMLQTKNPSIYLGA